VIVYFFLEPWRAASEPFYALLPLALAGFATAIIFVVQSFVGLFADRGQDSRQHQSFSKGANQ
jgi:hypothetical protein